jgi:DNA (cytosine-5)-methyltransferase 1
MTLAPPHRRTKSKPPRHIAPLTAAEFFAGIGLVRLALEHQKWKVLWANDIDEDKAEMYHANFGKKDLVVGDIHKIDLASIPDATLYTASFPCQDLSIAGAMAGLSGKESSAF